MGTVVRNPHRDYLFRTPGPIPHQNEEGAGQGPSLGFQSQYSLRQQTLRSLILGMMGAQVDAPGLVSWQPLAVGTGQHASHSYSSCPLNQCATRQPCLERSSSFGQDEPLPGCTTRTVALEPARATSPIPSGFLLLQGSNKTLLPFFPSVYP
jgi:hypothetical protein